MSEKGTERDEPRVHRRRAAQTPTDTSADGVQAPDLGDLLAGPGPEEAGPEPLKKGDEIVGTVKRVASDAVFVNLGRGLTGVLPMEAYIQADGMVRLKLGQELTGIVRVSPGASTTVLLSPGAMPPQAAAPVAEEADAASQGSEAQASPAAEAATPQAPSSAAPEEVVIAAAPRATPTVVATQAVEEEEEDFAALLADHLDEAVRITEGAEITGSVVKVTDGAIFVSLGAKTEGVLDPSEFQDDEGNLTLSVGDDVTAYVVSTGIDEGGIRLSRSMGAGPNPMEALQEAHELGVPIEARLVSRNKGGFEVKVGAVRGFLPLSQLDLHRVEEEALDDYIGQTLRFKIMRIKGKEVVVSRAELLKEEAAETIAQLKSELAPGMEVTGRVRSMKEYGAFIELAPGLDGLLHVSEISWGRVKHPNEVLEVGQEITVHVLKYDADSGRLSLGLKQLGRDPWLAVHETFSEGQTVSGAVVRLTRFGAFISLADGIDGLLHVSNMAWGRRINRPEEVVKLGDVVEVQILNIDPENKRIGLGLKQLMGDPWEGVEEKFPAGAQVEGTVEKVETFGVFVTVATGVTALLPMSESGLERGADAKRAFPVGSKLKAQVLDVDIERRRMSLSRKSLDGAQDRQSFASYKKTKNDASDKAAGFGTLAAMFSQLKKG